jgi:hypothetical protein
VPKSRELAAPRRIEPGMTNATSLLDGIRIAKPCPANWDEMTGDDRVRHCASCKLDVYDISSMKRDEAESFLAARVGKGRTCIRFYQRADGTILTQDCPVGVRAAWKKVTWAAAALVAGGFAAAAMLAPRGMNGAPQIAPLKQIYEFVQSHIVRPAPAAPMGALSIKGDCVIPSPPPPPATQGNVRVMGEASMPSAPVPPAK